MLVCAGLASRHTNVFILQTTVTVDVLLQLLINPLQQTRPKSGPRSHIHQPAGYYSKINAMQPPAFSKNCVNFLILIGWNTFLHKHATALRCDPSVTLSSSLLKCQLRIKNRKLTARAAASSTRWNWRIFAVKYETTVATVELFSRSSTNLRQAHWERKVQKYDQFTVMLMKIYFGVFFVKKWKVCHRYKMFIKQLISIEFY